MSGRLTTAIAFTAVSSVLFLFLGILDFIEGARDFGGGITGWQYGALLMFVGIEQLVFAAVLAYGVRAAFKGTSSKPILFSPVILGLMLLIAMALGLAVGRQAWQALGAMALPVVLLAPASLLAMARPIRQFSVGGASDRSTESEAEDSPPEAGVSAPKPGWLPDPWNAGRERYWTGSQWTSSCRSALTEAPANPQQPPPPMHMVPEPAGNTALTPRTSPADREKCDRVPADRSSWNARWSRLPLASRIAVVATPVALFGVAATIASISSRDSTSYRLGRELGDVVQIKFNVACQAGICSTKPGAWGVTPAGLCELDIKNRYGDHPENHGLVREDLQAGCMAGYIAAAKRGSS